MSNVLKSSKFACCRMQVQTSSHPYFQVSTWNPQPFCSPSALGLSLTQSCTLAQSSTAFCLGFPTSYLLLGCPRQSPESHKIVVVVVVCCFPTSCLSRHMGVPMGLHPPIVSLLAIFWVFWYKVKIAQADAATIWMDATPSRLFGALTSTSPSFLCWIPFLPQPSQFILVWDRQYVSWLAYPVACFIWSSYKI